MVIANKNINKNRAIKEEMSSTELAGKVWGSNLPCEYLLTDEVDWRHHYPDNMIFSDVFWFKNTIEVI